MTEAQIDNAIATCVIGLTRHVMDCGAKPIDEAYRDVYGSELYKLIANPSTRLFLSPNKELIRLYDTERTAGVSELYKVIA